MRDGGMQLTKSTLVLLFALSAVSAQTPAPDKPTAAGVEFFETKIRPVLAKNCYPCHSGATKVAMGGLFLDSRNGIRKGGAGGAAVLPGQPEESPLIEAISALVAPFSASTVIAVPRRSWKCVGRGAAAAGAAFP